MALKIRTLINISAKASVLAQPANNNNNVGLRRTFGLKSSFFFFSPSLNLLLNSSSSVRPPVSASPRFSMRVASKQAYICRDCGYTDISFRNHHSIYIYNERTPFEKVPDKYSCPVCGAPKRRFRAYQPAVPKNANDTDVRKARTAQIQRDEAIGRALPIAIAFGAAALAGLNFYLINTF